MLIFRFKDKGASAPHFKFAADDIEFDDDVLFAKEAMSLEQKTGRQINHLSHAFYVDRETEATMAFLWLALYRIHGDDAGLFTDLNPDISKLEVVVIPPDVVEGDKTPDGDQAAAAAGPTEAAASSESAAEPPAAHT